MSAQVFAYYRRPLVRNGIENLEARITEVASQHGGEYVLKHTFVELESPIRLLWSLGAFLNQRVDENIAEHVRNLAREHGYEYDRLRSYPTPAPALWRLVAALEAAKGGIVLIPSVHHLTDLEVPEANILQHLWMNLNAQVVWLESATGGVRNPHRGNPDLVYPSTGLLGQFTISPFSAALPMARFYCEECLLGSGYGRLADTIDALMVAIVGPVERRWNGNVDVLDERLTVRLVKPARSDVLVVEVSGSRDYGTASLDPMSQQIRRVRRQDRADGGTLTRYEVSIDGAGRR